MKSMVGHICNDRYIITKHDIKCGHLTIKPLSKYKFLRILQIFIVKTFK
jgi:hypothetical protein